MTSAEFSHNEAPPDSLYDVPVATPAPCQTPRPAWIVAVLPNGFPDRLEMEPASCRSIQRDGLRLDISPSSTLPAGRWVVGVLVGSAWQFVAVEVVHPDQAYGTAIEATFLQDDRDFLRARQRVPHCDPVTHRFQTTLSAAALQRWTELGVFEPQFYDRVLLCPKCEAVPSIRGGCQVCGSAQVASITNIHHFNCGYVGPATAFEQEDCLECPHCHAQHLVVGADYEYQSDVYTCDDCGWQDEKLEFVLQCLACELRFPIHQAVEHELIAHHVNRLDPLAAFPAT